MTDIVIRTALTDLGPISAYFQPGDSFRITQTGSLVKTGSGVFGIGGDVDFLIAGRLETGRNAISLGAMTVADQAPHHIRVADTGFVGGGNAGIGVESSAEIFNAGTISGSRAIDIGNMTGFAMTCSITNLGRIESALGYAIFSAGVRTTVDVTNSGTIAGRISLSSAEVVHLANSGRIEGLVGLGNGADLIENRGVMTGTVFMQGGADVFLGAAGKGPLVLDLGEGDDLAKLGRAAETVSGGAGTDVASYEAVAQRVVLNLADQARNAGAALGDRFDGIEVFRGSARGDVMLGDASDNRLEGLAGDDRLVGGAGNDTLEGGAGVDQLRGGLGVDLFIFDGAGADQVADFRGDVIGLLGTAFGLAPGALEEAAFAARAGHEAQGAERVLFDTTDWTLWVDLDGAGGADAVLVAQLQANAQLAAGDILVL